MAEVTLRPLDRLAPLVATMARRRMAVLAVTALLFSLFTVAVDVLMPLWATKSLHCSAGEWAQLRSLRMVGVLLGVILLGGLSDRFGQRLVGAISMLGVAVILVALALGPDRGIWVAMPIFGALVSTAFVNLNTLTQQVSERRQGLANTIYRSIGAGAGIVAPVGATMLALLWGGYTAVFYAAAVLLVASAAVLLLYPGEKTPPPAGNLRAEVARLWSGYATALRQRSLMRFIHISQIWGCTLAGVGAFAAIRFTRDLGQTDQQFGLVSTVGGILAFLATAGAGLFIDRVSIRKMHILIGVVSGLCAALMGVSDLLLPSVLGYLAFGPLTTMLVAPTSMWISRAAGAGTQIAAFSVHKVLSATYAAVAMVLVGILEQHVGMRNILLYGGLLGVITGLGFALLPEPKQAHQGEPDNS
ncbi:MAG: MFS transporter [Armatimonadota bacterium]